MVLYVCDLIALRGGVTRTIDPCECDQTIDPRSENNQREQPADVVTVVVISLLLLLLLLINPLLLLPLLVFKGSIRNYSMLIDPDRRRCY